MIPAPFTAAAATACLAGIATTFIALAGIAAMLRARRFAGRALALGGVVALLAGLAPQVFR